MYVYKPVKWEDEIQNLTEMVTHGETLQSIGDHYKVSRERIRQVLRQFSIPNGTSARKKNREASWYRKIGNKLQDHYYVKRQKFSNKKANAKRVGQDFTIQFGDLEWPSHCPILGLEIDYFADGRQENSPSIDRIDPTKGYIPGNVAVVSWRANRIKNDGTLEEHQKIVNYLSKL